MIPESITSEKCDALDLDVIQRKVRELLQGSSCLMSTRDEVVASIMGTCQAHHLSGLSENECWLLFKQYAFEHDKEERVELVEIGKEIAKKCGGLPLAAQALGGLMRSRSGEKEWLEIKESRLWDSPHDNYILPALRALSVYIVNLEKGNSLAKLRDLKLRGHLSIKGLNDVGSLSEAQKANLIVLSKYLKCFNLTQISRGIARNVCGFHHLSHDGMEVRIFPSLRSFSTFCSLTSLILRGVDEGITSFPVGMFRNLTFLQTLSICNFPKLKELPNEPFNLAMEELCIRYCDELESLPEQNWESLQSLRLLDISGCKGLRCLPEGIRHLTSLEALKILDCPTLKERCKEGTEEDWDKIAHIPKLNIERISL
ncbi:hypothetical protein TSUD_29820 [Trifolium subterraneum]|uniref:NB-ARC domain-containing protein n=1 Tax=Trifolium subterraneum TaxID=3900 RepID=A0A2Z6MV34_TRISU|nr:hypothetical protein TSUD_29820 [Trifolium subterraneum]